MKILVVTYKVCWKSAQSPSGWATNGGFVYQMQALASLADEVEIIAFEIARKPEGEIFFNDPKIKLSPIKLLKDKGWLRKLWVLSLVFTRMRFFTQKIKSADLVHIPVPSDLSFVGLLFSVIAKKPLFIRHCGNWSKPETKADHFWKMFMERNAGKKVLCLATGGGVTPPSEQNPNIKWIFSSSLLSRDMVGSASSVERMVDMNKIKLIVVSRQSFDKGAWRTLEAVRILVDKGFNIDFKIIGEGDFLKKLKDKTLSLALEDQVSFVGQVSNTEVIHLLHNSDIFVFPTTAPEGFPKAVLEAMSTGLPIITSSVSVLPDLIGQSESGIVLKELKPENIAQAIEQLVTNRNLYERYSQNAFKKAQLYTLEGWADSIKNHLNNEFGWSIQRKGEIVK